MGDPKVQRSDSGFFTRMSRAIDALGGETPKAKSGPSQAQVDAVQPLPKKYKAARRLDRTAISQSDPTASKVKQNESYVANALKLVDDMRALAVKEGAWYNRTTPKDVDKVINKYKPLLLAASGATSLEKSEMRKQLAEMMIKELYDTSTAYNLFGKLKSSPLYQCSSEYVESTRHSSSCSCLGDGGTRYETVTCSSGVVTQCTIAGKTQLVSTVNCSENDGCSLASCARY